MGKRSHPTTSDEKRAAARDLELPTGPPIKTWHPSKLRTGLSNRSIGKSVSVVILPVGKNGPRRAQNIGLKGQEN